MKKYFTPEYLRRLRNDIPRGTLLRDVLDIPATHVEDFLRCLCPLPGGFNTAVKPRTNLGPRFRCEQNFNPIDMVIIVKGYSLLQAVQYLAALW